MVTTIRYSRQIPVVRCSHIEVLEYFRIPVTKYRFYITQYVLRTFLNKNNAEPVCTKILHRYLL